MCWSQDIPIYFNVFKEKVIIDGITYVSNLFNGKFKIIFTADRWFNSKNVLEHINKLGCTYCFRLKSNLKISVFAPKEGHYIKKYSGDLISQQFHSKYYDNVHMYEDLEFETSIVISRKCANDEPWIIATNGNTKEAIRNYSHRFCSIECIFKNQKSNGFYLEDICTASLKSFISLYSLVCFSTLFLTILGADYTKNSLPLDNFLQNKN